MSSLRWYISLQMRPVVFEIVRGDLHRIPEQPAAERAAARDHVRLDRALRQPEVGGGRLQRDDRASASRPRSRRRRRARRRSRIRLRAGMPSLPANSNSPSIVERAERRRQRAAGSRPCSAAKIDRVGLPLVRAVAPRDVERAARVPRLAEGLGHHRDADLPRHDVAARRDDDDVDHARHRLDRGELLTLTTVPRICDGMRHIVGFALGTSWSIVNFFLPVTMSRASSLRVALADHLVLRRVLRRTRQWQRRGADVSEP